MTEKQREMLILQMLANQTTIMLALMTHKAKGVTDYDINQSLEILLTRIKDTEELVRSVI